MKRRIMHACYLRVADAFIFAGTHTAEFCQLRIDCAEFPISNVNPHSGRCVLVAPALSVARVLARNNFGTPTYLKERKLAGRLSACN